MGWERKRGLLNQLNEYLLGNIANPFRANTIDISQIKKVKYIITLDSDTDLTLKSGFNHTNVVKAKVRWNGADEHYGS